jgi:hypothetical protein
MYKCKRIVTCTIYNQIYTMCNLHSGTHHSVVGRHYAIDFAELRTYAFEIFPWNVPLVDKIMKIYIDYSYKAVETRRRIWRSNENGFYV